MDVPPDGAPVVAAVRAWWQAWQDHDRDALARMARVDYLEYPGGGERRNIGRQRLLEVADRSFARATIAAWSIEDVEVRRIGEVGVCSYRWTEQGKLDGAAFALSGFATDVLVRVDGQWRYQAHHVTNLPPDR
jgi:ketosteroid isomerase-like protein